MKTAMVENWLQLLGNVGIIIGLVLVGIQINQNTQLTRIQLIHESQLAGQNMHLVLAGENPGTAWTKAIFEPESLSDEEIVIVDRILRANLARLLRLETLHNLGFDLYGPEVVAGPTASNYLGSEFGRAWWDLHTGGMNSAFTKAVSTRLPALRTYEQERVANIRERISRNKNTGASIENQ